MHLPGDSVQRVIIRGLGFMKRVYKGRIITVKLGKKKRLLKNNNKKTTKKKQWLLQ